MNKVNIMQQPTSANFLSSNVGILQRKCACDNKTIAGGECVECANKKNRLQRKLTIGASNDPLEREADRVADQVLAMSSNSKIMQAQPSIQRFTTPSTGNVNSVPASVDRVLANSGKPLDSAIRQDMEQRFGQDFSQVRIHSNREAAKSTQDINAHAYTAGHNIVFGTNQYKPEMHKGRLLLAHELTHVIQQKNQMPNNLQRQSTPMPLSCPQIVASTTYSRGNDDWAECNYETARIKVDLVLDRCACGSLSTLMPLSVNYSATLEGKSFTGRNIPNPSGSGTVREQEGQASHIASGVATPGRSRAGANQPGLTLSEAGLPTGTTNESGPLVLTVDDSNPGGKAGDPGDTVSQRLSLPSVKCSGESKSGQVNLGGGFQVIDYNISADSTGSQASAITLTQPVVLPGRIATGLINVTAGGTPYPVFPGLIRPGSNGACACNATTGRQVGAGCNTGTGGAGVGP